MGSYQEDKAYYARRSIFKALSDGQWHRFIDLKEKSKLSPRTLAKHLNRMVKIQIIERKTDIESGKYPVPVLYKAVPNLMMYIDSSKMKEEFAKAVEPMLEESKDPLDILEMIHLISQTTFIQILEVIRKDKNITWDDIDYFSECYLWSTYKHFTMELIRATSKIIHNIDIDQLLVTQAKRQKEISERLIAAYQKMGFKAEQ